MKTKTIIYTGLAVVGAVAVFMYLKKKYDEGKLGGSASAGALGAQATVSGAVEKK